MKTFYGVTVSCFIVGMLIVCSYAPWTSTLGGDSTGGAHISLGYAPVWSTHFAGVPGARVDGSAIAILAAAVAFFSIVIGGAVYFFRGKRTAEKDVQ